MHSNRKAQAGDPHHVPRLSFATFAIPLRSCLKAFALHVSAELIDKQM
jgi:hypothetical protein